MATGSVLVAGLAVATIPVEVALVAWRTAPVAQATVPSIDVVPRAVQLVEPPPPTAVSTVLAVATATGATERGPAGAQAPAVPGAAAPEAAVDRPAPAALSGTLGEVVALTNERRRAAGCGPLAPDSRLSAAASDHAQDMSAKGYFDHQSRDGRRFEQRVRARGYTRPGAENIAMGQSSAKQVVSEWMASSSHRAAILTCAFRTIGVARVGKYWVQEFGR